MSGSLIASRPLDPKENQSLMSVSEGSTAAAGPLLLTVEEAARLLGIGRTTAYALVKSGELESIPLGRLRRIPAECVTEYISRLRAQARAKNQAA
jgi:excisionase family DNA binding protein